MSYEVAFNVVCAVAGLSAALSKGPMVWRLAGWAFAAWCAYDAVKAVLA